MKTETKFSINNNEKMFKILSSQLYTNKPLAIVRELSCNALDAHLSIKQQSPFIVMLKDTSIAFIDYGPGLSNDQMMKVYPAYGESTKEDNQEEIGGLGLGSKSPFSYTDEFLVISTQNYISNTYIARIEAGYPTLKLIHTEPNPSVEHGLMITIEIDPKDKRDFELSISNVLMYFPKNSYQTET